MLFPSFDSVHVSGPLDQSSIQLKQCGARPYAALALALLTPVAAVTAIPFLAAAAHATSDPNAIGLIADHPTLTLQFAAGLLLWTLLFVLPARRCIARLAHNRTINIEGAEVVVNDHRLWSNRQWREDMKNFEGLTHFTRTSASLVREELILVHPNRAKSLILALAPSITQSEIDAAYRRFELPEIPARRLFQISPPALELPAIARLQPSSP